MIEKGLLNSRVKDYYDIWMLSRRITFDGAGLQNAIVATFEQRGARVPGVRPDVLRDDYSSQQATRAQWGAFIKRLRASGVEAPDDFGEVVDRVGDFVMPAAAAAAAGESFDLTWSPARGWS